MDAAAARLVTCPVCHGGLRLHGRSLFCPTGHRFDVARQGHVNLMGGRRSAAPGDDASMVQARIEVFDAGLFNPVVTAVVGAATQVSSPGCVLDAGCGPGRYLVPVCEATGRVGVGCDVSAAAVRRIPPAPGRARVVADVWHRLPVPDGSAAVLLDVFSPRNGAEFARALHRQGALIVVTPAADHLHQLVSGLALIGIDPAKPDRLHRSLQQHFTLAATREVRWRMLLGPSEAAALAAMGPGGHRTSVGQLADRAACRDEWEVTGSVLLQTFTPKS